MKRVLTVGCALLALATFGGCGGGGAGTHTDATPPTDAVVPAETTPAQGSPTTGQPLQHAVPTAQPSEQLATGWRYRFEMIAPPNDNFAITNREFYLFFKPDTNAVHFRIENRRGVAAKILWDECRFTDWFGRQSRAVHRGVTYERRDLPQDVTWIQPNQMYADYLIPVDVLNDPNAATGGGQRELLPTDLRAQSMVGKIFSCKLVLGSANDDTRFEYLCTFKIVSTYREE